MTTVSLENDRLIALIHPKGAELQRLYGKDLNQEYLWTGDAQYWGKFSPVLFPIVGTLKENTFEYKGTSYTLPRHGFARDREFIQESISKDSVTFLLESDDETRKIYPFEFQLRLVYQLTETGIRLTYQVTNNGNNDLLFSVGGHPAFRIPLTKDTAYEDYQLDFNQEETAPRWLLQDGLIAEPEAYLEQAQSVPLRHQLFEKDAVVLKNLRSTEISIRSDKTERGLTMRFEGFPFFGIWAAPHAPFVCLEPWCGIADSIHANGDLSEKEGIEKLEAGAEWQRSWEVDCF